MKRLSPLVSILIPSYNHRKFIEKCIISIYEQIYSNYEVLVIDDGSSDGSREFLKELKLKYGFELLLQENIGLANTLNKGFAEFSHGKYLTFCASDDYWLPEKLNKQVEFMEEHPSYGMVFGKAVIIDSNSNILYKETAEANKNLKGGYIFEDIFLINFHPPVNYLIRSEVAKEMNYYRPNIWAEDFDLNLRIAIKYPIGFIDEYLSYYRRCDNGKVKMMNLNTVYSHLNSINLFQKSRYHNEAILRWNYRCFVWYCGYKEAKLFAFKSMLKSIKYWHKRDFIVAFIELMVKWN